MGISAAEEDQRSVVAIFVEHSTAEKAVRELKKWDPDIRRVSIVGRDYQNQDSVVGFYTTGERVRYWGKMRAFWDGFWSLLGGAGLFIVPGMGLVVVAGPVGVWIIDALEGAISVGGVTALGAGLVSLGVPKDNVLKYESSIKAGKFLLISQGTVEEVNRTRDILQTAEAEEVEIHHMPPEPARVA
jgi:hypothetical protein